MNTTFSLQDPDLFRQRAFVAGHWCDADSGATLEVNSPATGEILGISAQDGDQRNVARDRGGKRRLYRLESKTRRGAKRA